MTNHSETTGPFGNGDVSYGGPGSYEGPGPEHQVTLRTPAELADALPYLLGYRPEDSIVLVALHDQGGRGRFGGRARLGIPPHTDDWPSAARQLAQGLITGGERRGVKPEQMVVFLCQEPSAGESGREVMERLRPLAQKLRTECGRLDVPVIEALCISGGRFWSYCCPNDRCCPDEGLPMGLPGTSVLAAAAAYAGIQVRGSLRELRARLLPWETSAARSQEIALDAAGMALVPKILDEASRTAVAEKTLGLAERVMRRFAEAPAASGADAADLRDDRLLQDEEAATLILGLQDRTTRDRAAEWMEGDEAGPALRLWRALARRCVGPYGEHAAAPLTLAGWVAWSVGDGIEAREALAMALGADPDYLFARLLHQACNEGLDPESVRRCLRAEREARARSASGDAGTGSPRQNTGQTDDGGDRDLGDSTERAVARGLDGRNGAATEDPADAGNGAATEDLAEVGAGEHGRSTEAVAEPVARPTATGAGGSCPSMPDASSSRPPRSRAEGSGPACAGSDATRPATARTGSAHPGSSREPGRVRPRGTARSGTRRRGVCRTVADPRCEIRRHDT
ncbi:hypothetical protein GCM10014715_55300 [Streptomyces spiralis]|uniref:DUF4192 domain-containing protein n=1 Tax=Streptomyces spiralis TaxID=66376 RepID=A0A919DXX0_9ACTN|nr:DUF4192 family protein [Streptomyces spiralis]GHE91736.1 hypothetical protein GCM10014715_55300 [Streptomyces spiralis]